MTDTRKFDVALSFAGEQRDYVDAVNASLQDLGVSVYYDKNYEVQIWGENLVDHFSDIFKNQARFCVMFISEEYTKKVWTDFERQIVQSRELVDKGYILPVRFDDSKVDGLLTTKAYLSAHDLSPQQLASKIVEKVHDQAAEPNVQPPNVTYRQVNLKPTNYNPYRERDVWIDKVLGELDARNTGDERVDVTVVRNGTPGIRVVMNRKSIWLVNFNFGGYGEDKGISISASSRDSDIYNNSVNAYGTFDWDRNKKETVFKMSDLSFLTDSMEEQNYTAREFIDAVWDKILDLVESNEQ